MFICPEIQIFRFGTLSRKKRLNTENVSISSNSQIKYGFTNLPEFTKLFCILLDHGPTVLVLQKIWWSFIVSTGSFEKLQIPMKTYKVEAETPVSGLDSGLDQTNYIATYFLSTVKVRQLDQ